MKKFLSIIMILCALTAGAAPKAPKGRKAKKAKTTKVVKATTQITRPPREAFVTKVDYTTLLYWSAVHTLDICKSHFRYL